MAPRKIMLPVLVVAVIGYGVAGIFFYEKKWSVLSNQVASGVNSGQLNELGQRIDELDSNVRILMSNSGNAVPQADFVAAQRAVGSRVDALEQKLSNTNSSRTEAFDALSDKVEALSADIQRIQKNPPAFPSKPGVAALVKVKRPAKQPVGLQPPFQIIGVESRGSQRFLAIAPLGNIRLDDIQFIRPGDIQQTWRFDALDESSAHFIVNGTEQIVRVR